MSFDQFKESVSKIEGVLKSLEDIQSDVNSLSSTVDQFEIDTDVSLNEISKSVSARISTIRGQRDLIGAVQNMVESAREAMLAHNKKTAHEHDGNFYGIIITKNNQGFKDKFNSVLTEHRKDNLRSKKTFYLAEFIKNLCEEQPPCRHD